MDLNSMFKSEGKKIMGLERPIKGYNGTVMVQGQPVQVQSGVTVIQGKKFLVSDRGQVKDETGQDIGTVQNGQFVPMQQGGMV